MKTKKTDMTKKRIVTFLSIIFGILYIPWIIGILIPSLGETTRSIVHYVFYVAPAIAVFVTRKLTKDTSSLNFSIKVFKNRKALVFSAMVPSAAIFLGTVLFFLIFPEDLDFHGRFISETYGRYGAPQDIELSIGSAFLVGLIVYVISAVAIPVWFIALGEDIGWQGYMLPLLCRKTSAKRAAVLIGILWGLAHAPEIYRGLNYGTDYCGAPYTGILMMILVTVVLGIWMSYITLKTKNCIYAAIMHGTADIVGDAGVWVSLLTKSSLLGPGASGIIGLSVLLIGAVLLFFKMPSDAEGIPE